MPAPTLPTAVTALPTPPTISDPASFDVRADASMLAQQTMVPQINAAISNVYDNALIAYDAAVAVDGSEAAAADSALAASLARDAAIAAKFAAELALDAFDDRYLGAKAVAPTADNDGNALLAGALYFDTALGGGSWRAWNGSAWVTAPVANAASVINTPAGNLGATTVQAAIDELDSEKAKGGVNSDITSLAGLTTGLAGSRVQGLIGTPNAATPLTKYDLSADAVVLRNAAGGTVARYVTGTITNDLGLAGVTANGRDQVAAFAINSHVHLYFIWNGATLATISSLALPTVGPALPTGYTHWAYATQLRWNASSNIIPTYARGSSITYNLASGGVNRVLSAGTATAMTAVSCAGLVPPNAVTVKLGVTLSMTRAAAGDGVSVNLRPTGSTIAGVVVAFSVSQGVNFFGAASSIDLPLGTSQQIDYLLTHAPTLGGVTIDVLGFRIPNGDA